MNPSQETNELMDSSSLITQNEELYLGSSTFESCDDLLKSVRAFYYTKGYGLSIRDSKKDEYVALQCDRSGKKGTDGTWVFKIHNLEHNHEPSTDMSGHPSFRRLPKEDAQTVKNMTLFGIPPRQIISSLRQKSLNLPINSQTIYNLKAKLHKDDLGNRSLVGALLEKLEKGGFLHDVDHDSEGRITQDKDSYVWALKVFKKFLGHASQSAVIISDRELALMNGINDVFTSTKILLCVWHIQKNVFSNCKKDFENAEEFNTFMSRWNIVVYSITESQIEENWGEFELCYRDKKHSVEYIKTNWLPWKKSLSEKKLSFAVVNEFNEIKVKLASERIQIPHDCNMPLFRELLSHVSLFALKEIYKQYIKKKDVTTCTGHFMATMCLPCVHKINSLHGMTLSLDLVHPHWRIDTLSLDPEDDSHNETDEQFTKLLNELQSKYQAWPLSKKELATSMLTKFLNQPNILFEPLIQRPRGRPPKAKKKRGVTSTTRDPSRFEYVESSQAQDPSSSSNGFPKTIHQENGVIDLNAFPDF
ncbi:protein FAR1-related sequence 5 [Tanacetum coccineum]